MDKNDNGIGILSVGGYTPKVKVSNQKVVEVLAQNGIITTDDEISAKSGIFERYVCPPGQTTADIGYLAALDCLSKYPEISAEDIDHIFLATVTPDLRIPGTGVEVQRKLGAVNASTSDLIVGCSGLIYALMVAYGQINSGIGKYALVIGADRLSSITDNKDFNTSILLADGASCFLVGKVGEDRGFITFWSKTFPEYSDILQIPENDKYLRMQGTKLFKHIIKKVPEVIDHVLKEAGIMPAEVEAFFLHQANERITDVYRQYLMKTIGITKLESHCRVPTNIARYGNTSAATIGLLVNDMVNSGHMIKGKIYVMIGFGAGINITMTVLRW